MTLESGPATKDRNWQLLRTVIFLGFAAWFTYDGLRRYPLENRREAEQKLQAVPFQGKLKLGYDTLPETPDQPDYDRLRRSKPTTREEVRQALGSPTLTDGGSDYFVSRYGYIVLPPTGEAQWHAWSHTKAEITGQFYWAIIPLIPGLYFLWRTIKAATLRVVIDDQGMTYAGRRIALADMVSLRDYEPKGWIDLYYQSGARQRKLRLDNEKVARFDEIIEAICQAKGFRNEVKAYAEQKAREEAAEEAAQETAALREEAIPGGDEGSTQQASTPADQPPNQAT